LLTGREAFHRENPMKTLLAVVTDSPPPLRELNPYVPDDLSAVIQQSLAKDLAKRFRSAYEFETALAACSVAAEWSEIRAVEWWQAHPGATPVTGTDLSSLRAIPLDEPDPDVTR
jgi:serine/threonine protein kinase